MFNLSRPDVVPPVQKVEDGGRRPERVEHLSLRPGKRLFAHVDLHSNIQCSDVILVPNMMWNVRGHWPCCQYRSGHEGQRVHRICNLAPVLRITKEWPMSN